MARNLQLNGQWKVSNEGLKPLHKRADELKSHFRRFSIRHVFRCGQEAVVHARTICQQRIKQLEILQATPLTPWNALLVCRPCIAGFNQMAVIQIRSKYCSVYENVAAHAPSCICREFNVAADALSNEAIDTGGWDGLRMKVCTHAHMEAHHERAKCNTRQNSC